jgi:hypothetical protein
MTDSDRYGWSVSPERAQLEVELIRIWESIEPFTRTLHATPTFPDDVRSLEDKEMLRRWNVLFAEEIDTVRRARNSVVHAKPVSDENLEAAVTMAKELWRILSQRYRS